MSDVFIFGGGGHAKVIADILIQGAKYKIKAFVDDRLAGTKVLNIDVISEADAFKGTCRQAVVAIGDNTIRKKVARKIAEACPEMNFVAAIHPSSRIATDVSIGRGTVVMANAVVNPCSKIGEHCIINTAASVDHDCEMADFSSVAPGVTLGGNCFIGPSSAVSIGATLIHGIKIGAHSVIGAGSVVVKSLPENSVAYGTPARTVRPRKEGDRYL